MEYKRLPFYEYFANNSEHTIHTEYCRRVVSYKCLLYGESKKYGANYDVYYSEERQVIEVNFQCTEGIMDWLVNFKFAQKYYDSFVWEGSTIQLYVHSGWADMYIALKHTIRDEVKDILSIHPEAEIDVIGWSLGSALAQLCTQDLYFNLGRRVHLFSFGSVRPFKAKEAIVQEYLLNCCCEVYNFADVNDIVTYMPPFKHWKNIRTCDVDLDGKGRKWYKLFKPTKYHTQYDQPYLYDNY